MARVYYLIGFLLSFGLLPAQIDSSGIPISRLGREDLRDDLVPFDKQQVVTASRSLQEVRDLPFTTYIITAEEIRNQGYVTLVDALRMLPGIRVSQPGSGADGETFLLRGLLGNSYCKILVDGVPVKPFATKGMPIGAQLPVRQADRIEVIYGPAAALYGSDANAGVINIITKRSERPIYARANLTMGGNGFTGLDVFFGGKFGKDKHLMRFNVYASSVNRNDADFLDTEDAIYNPKTYLDRYRSPLVRQSILQYDSASYYTRLPQAQFPHQSRSLGLNLTYRGLRFSSDIFYRRDPSALGLNPVAVNYQNPQDFHGERTTRFRFGYQHYATKWGIETNVSGLFYAMDPQSSYPYQVNQLGDALYGLSYLKANQSGSFDQSLYDSLVQVIGDRYFTGKRFSSAESNEFDLDLILSVYPWKFLEWSAGIQGKAYLSRAQRNNLRFPNDTANDLPLEESQYANAFTQLILSLEKFQVFSGISYYIFDLKPQINPRLGVSWRANNQLSFRGFYGRALRQPPVYYLGQTYLIPKDNILDLSPSPIPLEPEETSSWEAGFRWHPVSWIYADMSWFSSKTENFIVYKKIEPLNEDLLNAPVLLGYFNFGDTYLQIQGIQSKITLGNPAINNRLFFELGLTWSQGEEKVTAQKSPLPYVREYPEWLIKTRLTYRWKERFFTTLDMRMATDFYANSSEPPLRHLEGYQILDLNFRYHLSRNFQTFFQFRNLLGAEYGGISATGTGDDLQFNPQMGRTLWVGLSYDLEQ
ncbi:MAG: TonB-dependent receptor [Saprospiraceae bacterium]|nr:TonB-dependent receptor [Saprospiraceae bacterium]